MNGIETSTAGETNRVLTDRTAPVPDRTTLIPDRTAPVPGAYSAEKQQSASVSDSTLEEMLKEKHGRIYRVKITLRPDDDTEVEVCYFFKRPGNPSYNRYVKTASKDMTNALKAFMFDSVVDESKERLEEDLEEYPALALGIGERLLAMMGLADTVNLKKL